MQRYHNGCNPPSIPTACPAEVKDPVRQVDLVVEAVEVPPAKRRVRFAVPPVEVDTTIARQPASPPVKYEDIVAENIATTHQEDADMESAMELAMGCYSKGASSSAAPESPMRADPGEVEPTDSPLQWLRDTLCALGLEPKRDILGTG